MIQLIHQNNVSTTLTTAPFRNTHKIKKNGKNACVSTLSMVSSARPSERRRR